ncbi:hypothetical protein ACFY78_10240 [Streptomyces olindensis]|uniref:hypothetical protein n=1 Tax=Streptomyces olindensis TaxID=358823 RepID=UPI0036C4EC36
MTGTPSERDQAPIYQELVRERGDVVAEAQSAAEHTQQQAARLLGGHHADQPYPGEPLGQPGRFASPPQL